MLKVSLPCVYMKYMNTMLNVFSFDQAKSKHSLQLLGLALTEASRFSFLTKRHYVIVIPCSKPAML